MENRYSELKYNGEIYTEQWKIDEILIDNKFNWMVNAEIKNARLEIFQDTLVWNAGIWYNGDWYFGVWRDGEWRYGTWQNGVFYNGVWRNGTFKSGIIFNGKFFKGKIESGEIRGGQFIDVEISPNVTEYTGDEFQAKKEEEQQKTAVAQAQPEQPNQNKVRVHFTSPTQEIDAQPKIQQEKKEYKNMKRIKTFETFNPKVRQSLDISRQLFKSKGFDKFLKTLSLIDDLIHLDFKNIKNSLKNKEGHAKAIELSNELALLLSALKQEDIPWYNYDENLEPELFQDIKDYGIDVKLILGTLEDPVVKDYMEIDKRFAKRIDVKYKGIIELLKRYENWEKMNVLKSFESVGELEDSFVDINIDETELEDSDRPNLGKLKQKAGIEIIETPSKTDAYNAKMRKGGEVIQEPGFSDKQLHHVKSINDLK